MIGIVRWIGRRSAATAILLSLLGTTSHAQVTPYFPAGGTALSPNGASTWQGGDAPSMVTFYGTPNLTLWTFGDCFIEPPGVQPRSTFPIGNVLCVAQNINGVFTPTYFFQGSPQQPAPFFADPASPFIPGGCRLWPSRSFYLGGKLFIVMFRVANGSPDGKFQNGEYLDTLICRINNPSAPSIWEWTWDWLDLAPPTGIWAGAQPTFGQEAVLVDDNLCIYGVYGSNPTHTVVLKVPYSTLFNAPAGSIYSSVQYLNYQYTWVNGVSTNIADYWDCQIPTAPWFSISYNGNSHLWQCIFVDTAGLIDGNGNQIWLPYMYAMACTATGGPFGPWQPAKIIYQFPEMTPGNPLYDPYCYCYPGPGNAASLFYSDPNDNLVFTYVANESLADTAVDKNWPNLYFPKVVQVPNPLP